MDAGIGRLLRDRSIAPGTAFADAVGAAVAEFSAEEGGGGVEEEGEGDDYMAEAGEYARHIGLPHPPTPSTTHPYRLRIILCLLFATTILAA